MSKPVLAVLGATGAQGGGLARAALADGTYHVRAVTRNVTSDKARALAAAGAEVVAADLNDEASLKKAFTGAAAVFAVTNFWEHFTPELEIVQAMAIANAAKDTGVKHVIWSTLDDTRRQMALNDPRMPTLMGSYKVPHFDAKGQADSYFSRRGVPTTFLLTSFYWDNLIAFGMQPKRGPDGKLGFVLPMDDKPLSGIAVEDIGKIALGIFKGGDKYIGKYFGAVGEHLTGAQMAAALSKTFGETVTYNYVPPEVYRTFGFPGAEDLGNMFQYKRDFNEQFVGCRDVNACKALVPALQDFAAFLAANGSKIPRE